MIHLMIKKLRFDRLFGNYPLGYSLWDKVRVTYWRLVDCNHDTQMCLDLGDEDRGSDWYCFRCARYPGHKYDTKKKKEDEEIRRVANEIFGK
jgi:hypothetical protein